MDLTVKKAQTLTEQQKLCALFEQHMSSVAKLLQSLVLLKHPPEHILPFLQKTLQEAYRIEPNDMLNALVHSVKLHKIQCAFLLLERAESHRICQAFKQWKH